MAVAQKYSTIESILKNISRDEIILNVNDENRSSSQIDLNDAADQCRIRVEEQTTSAAVEINGYLANKYSFPFDVVPDLLKEISDDITVYKLYKRRLKLDMPESIETIYKRRLDQLREIQKGIINLGVEQPKDTTGAAASEIQVNKTAEDRIFSDGLLTKF